MGQGRGDVITRRGIGLLIAALVLVFVGGVTRIGWVMLVDAVLWGGLILSAATPWLFAGRLELRRRAARWASDPGPSEGEDVRFEYIVKNTGRLPVLMGTYRYGFGPEVKVAKEQLFLAWLRSGRTTTVNSDVVFSRRGLHTLPPLTGDVSLPFGLFRRRPRLGAATQILVYPKTYPVAAGLAAGLAGSLDTRPAHARVGDQVIGSRRFTQGDPVRHIHWRSFARLGTPQVKEFEDAPDDVMTIYFSAHQLGETLLEDAVRIAASLGAAICRAGRRVRVLGGSVESEYHNDEELLRDLAFLTPERGLALDGLAARVGPGSHILAIVSSDDEVSQARLAGLAGGGRQVTAVLLDATSAPDVDMELVADGAPAQREQGANGGWTEGGQGVSVVPGTAGDIPAILASLERFANPRAVAGA